MWPFVACCVTGFETVFHGIIKFWRFLFLPPTAPNEIPTKYKSGGMRFPTMWFMQPAKAQISLRIRAV